MAKRGVKAKYTKEHAKAWRKQLRKPKMTMIKLSRKLRIPYSSIQRVLIAEAYGELP